MKPTAADRKRWRKLIKTASGATYQAFWYLLYGRKTPRPGSYRQ